MIAERKSRAEKVPGTTPAAGSCGHDGTGVLVTEEGDAGTISSARLASARQGPDGVHQVPGSE